MVIYVDIRSVNVGQFWEMAARKGLELIDVNRQSQRKKWNS